jgi:TonB family protein
VRSNFGIIFFIIGTLAAEAQGVRIIKAVKDSEIEIASFLKPGKTIKHGPYEKYFKYSNPISSGKILIEKGQFDNNAKSGLWTFYWGEANVISKGAFEHNLRTGTWEYYKNGNVIEKGDYKNDLREGLWTYFEKDKGILERGYYKDGKKIGKWIYHYRNTLVQTFDYSVDSVLQSYHESTEAEIITDSEGRVIKGILSRLPQYIGHKRQMQTDLSALTVYPLQARRMGVSGKVMISFTINEDGNTGHYEIIKDIDAGCGESVIDAYMANNVKWIPAIYNGKKVKVKYYQVVTFDLTFDPITSLGQSVIVYE